MNYIYVVDKKGKPLMPTTRQSHVRRLIKNGKAVVINNKPFVVRLKYETTNIVQGMPADIDTGRENIVLQRPLKHLVYSAQTLKPTTNQ